MSFDRSLFHRERLTLSRMTRGPFTPPIVLYVIRGLMESIRGSSFAEGIAKADGAGHESQLHG